VPWHVLEVTLLGAPDLIPCAIPARVYNTQEEKEGRGCRSNQPKYGYFSAHSPPRTDCGTVAPLFHPSYVPDTPAVFRLPYEAFQEILSHLPILPRVTIYHRLVHETMWPRPGPEIFLERARTLLALSATCRLMRQLVLAEGWNNYFMRRMNLRDEYQIWVKLLFECGVLFGKPHLAAHVRYGSLFVYLGCTDTGPDHSKDPSGRSFGRYQKSSRTLRQMPHHSTQPPHPRDGFDIEI